MYVDELFRRTLGGILKWIELKSYTEEINY